jgi:hypothetical protein
MMVDPCGLEALICATGENGKNAESNDPFHPYPEDSRNFNTEYD